MTVTERELALAKSVARKVGSKWSLAEVDDLASELALWLVEHESVLERYRADEFGEGKLFVSLRRRATKWCAREQMIRSGGPLEDFEPYTVAQVERALPFIFEDIPQTVHVEGTPFNGGHGLALVILTDLRGAFQDMPEQVRETIALRFRDGMSFTDMGRLTGISGEAAKKRVQRAVRRMRDHLSGSDESEVDVRMR